MINLGCGRDARVRRTSEERLAANLTVNDRLCVRNGTCGSRRGALDASRHLALAYGASSADGHLGRYRQSIRLAFRSVLFLEPLSGHVRRVLDTLAERLRTDKRVKLGPFELTADAEVIALDPKESGASTESYSPDDVGRMERMFEFISEPDSFLKLISWVEQNVTPSVNIGDFLTESPYASQREQAYRALIEGGQR